MKDLPYLIWLAAFLLLVALAGCSAVMDMRRDCDVLVEKLRDAKAGELWSVSQVYRANGCTDSRHLLPDTTEWVRATR